MKNGTGSPGQKSDPVPSLIATHQLGPTDIIGENYRHVEYIPLISDIIST